MKKSWLSGLSTPEKRKLSTHWTIYLKKKESWVKALQNKSFFETLKQKSWMEEVQTEQSIEYILHLSVLKDHRLRAAQIHARFFTDSEENGRAVVAETHPEISKAGKAITQLMDLEAAGLIIPSKDQSIDKQKASLSANE